MVDVEDGPHRIGLGRQLDPRAYSLADRLAEMLGHDTDPVVRQQAIELLVAMHADLMGKYPGQVRFVIDAVAKHAKQLLGVNR